MRILSLSAFMVFFCLCSVVAVYAEEISGEVKSVDTSKNSIELVQIDMAGNLNTSNVVWSEGQPGAALLEEAEAGDFLRVDAQKGFMRGDWRVTSVLMRQKGLAGAERV